MTELALPSHCMEFIQLQTVFEKACATIKNILNFQKMYAQF